VTKHHSKLRPHAIQDATRKAWGLVVALAITIRMICPARAEESNPAPASLDWIAASYVKLTLNVGLYDADLVDAYFGPPEWKPAPLTEDQKKRFPRAQFERESSDLLRRLDGIETAAGALWSGGGMLS